MDRAREAVSKRSIFSAPARGATFPSRPRSLIYASSIELDAPSMAKPKPEPIRIVRQ